MSRPVLFFGVCSEGMGHATRVVSVAAALSARYEVHLFCGGRAHAFLSRQFPHVHRVQHVRLCYQDNRLLLRRSVAENLVRLPGLLLSLLRLLLLGLRLRPRAILTDFECLTSWAGALLPCPVISISNQDVARHGVLPRPPAGWERAAQVLLRSIAWNTPVADVALISSFYRPPLRPGTDRARVRYVPVAVRPLVEAYRRRTREDGPVLVYQTSASNHALPETLRRCARSTGLSFVVYGAGRTGAELDGRIRYRPFAEEGFVADMARAPFVIVNGGHSTICEALSLGKPVLAEPIRDQYEQALNVQGLVALGVGRGVDRLRAEDVFGFAAEAPHLRRRARALRLGDRAGLVQAIERAIEGAS